MEKVLVGGAITAIGIGLAWSGVRRLRRRRRTDDVEWDRRSRLGSFILGGVPGFVPFDRAGAAASVVVGVLAVVLGLAVLLLTD